MNNKILAKDNSNLYIKITKKISSLVLVFFSISFFLILISFHPEDSGWRVVSENAPNNFYGQIGAFFSGFVIREFGLLPGLLFSSILFIWSLKLFNGTIMKNLKIKFITIVLMIFLSSLGGAFVETELTQKINLNFSILSQNGLSEGLLLKLSKKFSDLVAFNFSTSILIIGSTSLITSLFLFVWISSIGPQEIRFFKLVTRPIFLPLMWILTMIFNLLINNNNYREIDSTEQITKRNYFEIVKNKLLKLKDESITRKKTKN